MSDAAPAARDPWFDNARFLLIALVVVGHAIEPLIWGDVSVRAVYELIYAFHMPAFVFLAGAFAPATLGRAELVKLLRRIALPYLVFDLVYVGFDRLWIHTPNAELALLKPYWLLWFLMSLFWWRLLLPVLARAPSLSMVLAVGAALAIGRYPGDGYFLSLSRTVAFLPFFLLGHLVRRRASALADFPLAGAAVLLLGALGAWWLAPELRVQWLYQTWSDANLGMPGHAAELVRLGLLAAAALLGAGFLACVPSRPTFFTEWGARSLNAYLLHGFLAKAALASGLYRQLGGWPSRAALVLVAVLVAAALSSRPVGRLMAPLLGR